MRIQNSLWTGLYLLLILLINFCPDIPTTSSAGSHDEKLIFVYTRPQDHEMTKWLTMVYTEAFNRLSIAFEFMEVPPKRASEFSNSGKVDGELGRVYDYNKKFTNMIRVEEHHLILRFLAFSAVPDLSLDGWDSLKATDFIVAHRNGIKKCEVKLPRVLPAERIMKMDTVNQGIKMLVSDRIDIFIDIDGVVMKYLESEEHKNFAPNKKVYRAGLMEMTTGHLFLHKKHRVLAPKIAVILKKMKRDGLFDHYREAVNITEPFEY